MTPSQTEKMKNLHERFQEQELEWKNKRIKAESDMQMMKATACLQQEMVFTSLLEITKILTES